MLTGEGFSWKRICRTSSDGCNLGVYRAKPVRSVHLDRVWPAAPTPSHGAELCKPHIPRPPGRARREAPTRGRAALSLRLGRNKTATAA